MIVRSLVRRGVLSLGAAGFLLASPVYAQLTTFANVATQGSALKFTNNGASSTFGTTTGSAIPVTFKYLIANDTGFINTDIAATMTLSAQVTGGPGGFNQAMNNINIVITANSAINGKTNLLTMALSSGTLSKGTTTTATLGGTQGSGGVDTVLYSSDFLDFTGTSTRDFSITNTAISPSLTALNGNGYMNTWTGTGTGSFSSDPAPTASSTAPEPTALGLLTLGGFVFVARRRNH